MRADHRAAHALLGEVGAALGRADTAIRALSGRRPSSLSLGGGTALALRWKHRHSTDVDLFMEFGEGQAFLAAHGAALSKQLAADPLVGDDVRTFEQGASWTYLNMAPVSLAPCIIRYPDRHPAIESGTGMPLLPVAQTLHGKLIGRMLYKGQMLTRDAYDLACALACAPNDLREVAATALAGYPEALADLPHALERLSDSHRVLGSQIIDPRFPEVADNPWRPLAEWAKSVVNPANRKQAPDRRPCTKREARRSP